MLFLIADTFTDSLSRLTGDEQKLVKTTVFDLQLNPARPGRQLHKLDRARDRNFWSVRVDRDVRLMVYRSPISFLDCHVDHHDRAYAWAERRRLEAHPRGAVGRVRHGEASCSSCGDRNRIPARRSERTCPRGRCRHARAQ